MTYTDDDRTLSLSIAELVERDGPELLARHLRAEIRRRREATARYWDHLVRYERANATGLAMWRAVQDAHCAGRKTVRVADLLALTGTRPKGMTPDERARLAGVIETGLARLDRDLLSNTRLTWALVNAIEDAGCALIEGAKS